MKIIYLLIFLFHYAFSVIHVVDTDLNRTVAKLPDVESIFGAQFYDEDAGYLFISDPLLACGDSIKPPFISFPNFTEIKLVALIKRGNCTFEHKVAVAQASGYTGVIIYNYENGNIFPMRGDSPNNYALIPSRMVSLTSGRLLRSLYTFTTSRQNYILYFYENSNINPQYYIIAFLGFISLGFFIIGIGFGIKICRDAWKRRANRLRQCHLKKIPIKKYNKAQDSYETCAICLEDFKDGEKLRILPCHHAYHSNCIDPWLLKQKRNCPICKTRIRIPGRDDDSDCTESTPSENQIATPDEQTPLINATVCSSPRYLSNNEPDVHFIPDENKQSANCYENLSFGIGESQPGTSNNTRDQLSINGDLPIVCNEDLSAPISSDLTKIV